MKDRLFVCVLMFCLAILVKDSHETDAATSALFRDIASMVYRLNC